MTPLPKDTQQTLDLLRRVAAQTIQHKRRLGHYVVVWQDGKSVAVGEDAPPTEQPKG